MFRQHCRLALLVVMAAYWPLAEAKDWFVRAGSANGDGSKEKPFGDPWQALNRVEANDKVHVTAGQYFGRLERGNWMLEVSGVQLLGGYDTSFRNRNPWKYVSELRFQTSAPNSPDVSLARIGTSPQRDTAGATIDGFLIDVKDAYRYAPDGNFDLNSIGRPGAVDLAKGGVLKNSIVLNGVEAVRLAGGAIIENTVIVNSVRVAVTARVFEKEKPPHIRHSTIAFVWDPRIPGQGGAEGHGIDSSGNIVLEDTIVMHADNAGLSVSQASLGTVSGNVFWRNLFANVTFSFEGKRSSIDDSEMGSMEDVGFKKAAQNRSEQPKLQFDKGWFTRFVQRTAGLGKRFDAKAWEATRATAGIEGATEKLTLFAPAYPSANSASLAPVDPTGTLPGAHAKDLPVSFEPAKPPLSPKTYVKATLEAMAQNPQAFDGKAVEVIAGIVGVGNVAGVPETSPETHRACTLTDAKGNGRTLGVYQKGFNVERMVDDTPTYGSNAPVDLFVIRGVAKAGPAVPRSLLLMERIEHFEPPIPPPAPRPTGQDWFVRAGESGGDGSKEKPFKDMYQAIDAAKPGDRILVAEGEYNGKLKSGKWQIAKPFLTLLGGYNRDFSARNPWQTVSLLQWPADSKTEGQGVLLEGTGEHNGLIVDGFVFDRKTFNRYDADGFLASAGVRDDVHLSVSAPDSVVRNCVFINGTGGAVRMSNAVTFENNIVANVWNSAVKVSGGFGTRPAVIRNNTILFVYTRHPYENSASTGSGVDLDVNAAAIIEGNAIQYVDNFALKINARPLHVVVNGNTFFRNFAAFRGAHSTPPPTIDEKNLSLLSHVPFLSAVGNRELDGAFPLNPEAYASWFLRTSQFTERVSPEEWKKLAPPTLAPSVKPGIGRAIDVKDAVLLFSKESQAAGARRLTL